MLSLFICVKVRCSLLSLYSCLWRCTVICHLFVAVMSRLLFDMVAVNFTVTGHLNACVHSLYSSWCHIRPYYIWVWWTGPGLIILYRASTTPLQHCTFAIIKSLASVKEVAFRTFVLTYLLAYRWHFSSPKTQATQQSAEEGAGGGRGEGGNLCPPIVSLSTPLSPLCQEDWQYSPPTLTFKMFHPSLMITQLWTR